MLSQCPVRQQARWTKPVDPSQAESDGPPVDDRERLLIEAVVTLARSLRDERDRLAGRLRDVENELQTLTSRLEPGSIDPPGSIGPSEAPSPD